VPFDKKAMASFNKVLTKLERKEGVSFTKEEVAPSKLEIVEIDEDEEEEVEEDDEIDEE
jgi:hypothetical protein